MLDNTVEHGILASTETQIKLPLSALKGHNSSNHSLPAVQSTLLSFSKFKLEGGAIYVQLGDITVQNCSFEVDYTYI